MKKLLLTAGIGVIGVLFMLVAVLILRDAKRAIATPPTIAKYELATTTAKNETDKGMPAQNSIVAGQLLPGAAGGGDIAVGTGTARYLRWGTATGTIIVPTAVANQLKISFFYAASSTDTPLLTTMEGSNDRNDFFYQSCSDDFTNNSLPFSNSSVVGVNVVVSTSTPISPASITYPVNTTATTTFSYICKPNSNWTRITFQAGTSTSVTSAGAVNATIEVMNQEL